MTVSATPKHASCSRPLRIWVFAAACLAALPDSAAEPGVPLATDLRADALTARARGMPILLLFAADTCSYCAQVESDYLVPMLHSADYVDKVLIRKILVRDPRTLVAFDGATVASADIAQHYRVELVPTLVFVDTQGREISERLVGLTTVDFYWGYLERSLDMAHASLAREAR